MNGYGDSIEPPGAHRAAVDAGLPPGRQVELPGRGTPYVPDIPGPPGAPVVVLLHGLMATADLNWISAYSELARLWVPRRSSGFVDLGFHRWKIW